MNSITAAPTADFLPVIAAVDRYYSDKVLKYGPTPLGVDWSCVPTQELRFVQLLKVCDFGRPLSINDVGCGYGALLTYLARRHRGKVIDYQGIDLCAAMIAQAKRLWAGRPGTRFDVGLTDSRKADYSIASGIFNVKLNHSRELWERLVADTLRRMSDRSSCGFAANFLLPPPVGSTFPQELYCAEPDLWRSYCERNLGVKVEILSGYGMREYTLIARNRSVGPAFT